MKLCLTRACCFVWEEYFFKERICRSEIVFILPSKIKKINKKKKRMSKLYFERIPEDIVYEICLRTAHEDLRKLCANKSFQKVCSTPYYQRKYLELRVPKVEIPEEGLLWAAEMGSPEFVKRFLEMEDVDIDYWGDDEKTPLIQASEKGYEDIVRLLINADAHIDSANINGETALDYALQNRHDQIVGLLVGVGAYPAVIEAVKNGQEERVLLLLNAGVDPDFQNYLGERPLLAASELGQEGIVSLLLSYDADPDMTDFLDTTPLMMAVDNGHEEIVQLLLDADADPNLIEMDGNTALMYAALTGDEYTVELLLDAKADITLENNEGKTALKIAQEEGHKDIVELMEDFVSSI